MKSVFVAVALMALVTYIPRVLPVTIFRKEIKSVYIKSFLRYVPYAVLGALTFPDIFYSTGNIYTAIVGIATALFLAYKEKSLVIVALGSIIAAYLTGLFV
jgi:branched-subunit amino acid transport protein